MKTNKYILKLLTPSWVVSVVGATIGVLGTAAVIVLTRYQASDLRLQVFDVQSKAEPASTADIYKNVGNWVADNSVLSAAPMLIVWTCVGLGIYFLAISVVNAFSKAAELREELEYVHASRHSEIREALTHFAVRAVSIVGWFLFIKLSLAVIIPYALALASIASTQLNLLNVWYALSAVGIIYLNVYVHAVFLRLIFLKPRLFG